MQISASAEGDAGPWQDNFLDCKVRISGGIPIVHQDEHIVVVNKPAPLLVVSAPGRAEATLLEILQRQLGETLFPVHRLDEETTGVLVVCKSEPAQKSFEQLFLRHELERIYLALLQRVPVPPAGRIESRLSEDERGMVASVSRGGELAITEYRSLVRRGPHALVQCRLETGRRNQIRVHMAELGVPVVGDRKYGWRPGSGLRPRRPLLHALRIAFTHPFTHQKLSLEVAAPEPELAAP